MAKNLEQDALEVRREADKVQERFLKILEIGSPAVADLAYAIKSRVKDDFKIVEKVIKKRVDKPSYQATDLRDIVGVRVVTLYRLDALRILPVLLERIRENSGSDETKLFHEEPLEEIKIYSVNPKGDAQKLASRIESIFKGLGYGDKCGIEQKEENYTSVHMVVWSRAKWNKTFLDIPVEIQLRTALEDVWSEMDHQLKYKKSIASSDNDNASMMQNCLAHLNVMKTLNDGLAQYGDQVKIQIDHLDNSIRRHQRVRLAEEPETRLKDFDEYTDDVCEKIRDVLGTSREAFEEGVIEARSNTKRVSNLLQIKKEIESLAMGLRELSLSSAFAEEVEYVLTMECALVCFEIGRRMGVLAGNEYLIESGELYDAMADKYPDRGIIPYRYARVLYELGERKTALEKLTGLVENFEKFDLPPDHWVRSAALRILGFWYWDRVERVGGEPDDRVVEDSLDDVLFAAVCSLRASQLNTADSSKPNEVLAESPRSMALSNLLFFVVEFLEAGGAWASLGEAGITKEVVGSAKAEVSQFDQEEGADFRKLNTLRRVAINECDLESARSFAEMAIKQLEAAGVRDRGGATVEEHVLRRCRETVAL